MYTTIFLYGKNAVTENSSLYLELTNCLGCGKVKGCCNKTLKLMTFFKCVFVHNNKYNAIVNVKISVEIQCTKV